MKNLKPYFHSILFAFTMILFVVFLNQCKNKTESFVSTGPAYFDYKPGDLREYDLDSSAYVWTSGQLAKFHFLVKEKVIDTFTDLSGNIALRVEQYISRDTGLTYSFYKLNSIYLDAFGSQRVEENQRYVKMVFPISGKRRWDGNIYNNLGYHEYSYTGIDIGFSNNYLASTNCVEVTQQDDSTLISRDKQVEIYTKVKSLVYKYDKSIEYNPSGQPQGHIVIWNLRRIQKK